MASLSLMHCAHTADTRSATIFILNGAPQALVGCLGPKIEKDKATEGHFVPPANERQG
jgi:hypothetical protein